MPLIHRDTPCPGCGYNLRGLDQQHRCPECGHLYDFLPGVRAGTTDVPRFGRMNPFDKICAVLAALLAVVFLICGAFGLFLGLRLSVELPPVLGVLPALAGWGIYRMFRIAWQSDRVARRWPARPKPIPNIYRDPIPNAHVEALDRELAERIPSVPEEPSADAYPR